MPRNNRQHLFKRIETRRIELGLSVDEAARRAGNTRQTWLAIKKNPNHTITQATKAGIERAIRWQPGSFDTVADGGEPTPLDYQPPTPPTPGVDGENRGRALLLRSMIWHPQEFIDQMNDYRNSLSQDDVNTIKSSFLLLLRETEARKTG